ncbi:RIC1-domain-containing protein [Spinellus fusiger]|nr:RIC1-domain-containing protein [Spinellus fusiger]
MYWLNGIASQLSPCNTPHQHVKSKKDSVDKQSAVHFLPLTDFIAIQPSHHASLFLACSRTALSLWSVKRSNQHVSEFGENVSILWKPDGSSVVIVTSRHYLLLYAILPFDQRSFDFHFTRSQHSYVTGPGEGKGPRTILLKFRLAIRIDAGIACGFPTDDTLIIATQTPAAIQCISWNPHKINSLQTSMQSSMGILVNSLETVTGMIYDRAMNISVWRTNQGRAYLVQNGSEEHDRQYSGEIQESSSPTSSTLPPGQISKGYHSSHSHAAFDSASSAPSLSEVIYWGGILFHGTEEALETAEEATCIAINSSFSLIAIGTKGGTIYVYSIQSDSHALELSHTLTLPHGISAPGLSQQGGVYEHNTVQSLAWTSDGYAISVGYEHRGLAVWSVYGALLSSTSDMDDVFSTKQRQQDISKSLQDTYVYGVKSMFWGPGNYQLFILNHWHTHNQSESKVQDAHLFVLPFSKLAITSLHNSENARRGLLQTDDRLLLYNHGGDYQDNNTTTIDPDAVVWTHILHTQYPGMYITDHWPIRYSSVSGDGKFIAIAGRKGLAHYNTTSGRWKMFGNQQQEESFVIQGGLAWYKHVLMAACMVLNSSGGCDAYELRLYSRDNNLDNAHVLHTEVLRYIPVYVTICGSFLLVLSSENVLNIYSIFLGNDGIMMANTTGMASSARIRLTRQISFANIVSNVSRIRGINLFNARVGDQITTLDEIRSTNIIVLIDGRLVMLCPTAPDHRANEVNKNDSQDQYELHILSEKTEYYWIGRKSIANLLTSLWAVDGKGIKVFTNLLRGEEHSLSTCANDVYESEPSTPTTPSVFSAKKYIGKPFSLGYRVGQELDPSPASIDVEGFSRWTTRNLKYVVPDTIHIPLDFYPHSVLLEKGVIVGIEQNIIYKDSLGFMIYKISTKTHLFLHHFLRHLLKRDIEEDAVVFAKMYEKLVYFSHALEILLHTVLEEEAGQLLGDDAILPLVIKFLDHFPHALDVIVSCARKTEVALWDHLFSVVGKPKDLFELCLADDRLRTATSYLIILQTMQPLAIGGKDTTQLLQRAIDVNDYELCKELIRFLSSIDNTGKALQEALHVIKSHMEPTKPSSPSTQDIQVDTLEQSIHNMST